MSAKDLARALVAAGAARLSEGEGMYLVYESGNELVEKLWVGDGAQDETVIAEDVREGTSAPYLFDPERGLRLVFFIDQSNAVQCYGYKEEVEDWKNTGLGDKWNLTAGPNSRLSANFTADGGFVVCYQDSAGLLRGVMSAGEDRWEAFGPLQAKPIEGTPQQLEIIDDKLHLFYVGTDSSIHYLVLDAATSSWQVDNVVPGTKFDTPIENCHVAKNLDTGSMQSYILSAGSLWNVDGVKDKPEGQNPHLVLMEHGGSIPVRRRRSSAHAEDLLTDLIRSNLSTTRWQEWIVKLVFERNGVAKEGNGFYVNVPNKTFNVILTAGHNIVDAPHHYCANLRIVTAHGEIPVPREKVHVCSQYIENPTELNAIYDYAAILLDRGTPIRGFGFSLQLGLAPLPEDSRESAEEENDILQDQPLNVGGYRPGDFPSSCPPSRAGGKCISAGRHQLMYTAETVEGISGGPVWLEYRGFETIVAIHNYGEEEEGLGNRGSRLNLDVWRTIFSWVGVGWASKSLHYLPRPPSPYSMHLHVHHHALPATASRQAIGEGRVRVGQPGRIDTRFDILPVTARPGDSDFLASYGFLLCAPPGPSSVAGATTGTPRKGGWLRWDAKTKRVELWEGFDSKCEVTLPKLVLQPDKPFDIRTRLDKETLVQVRMAMKLLNEEDLELLADDEESYEDTSEIIFEGIKGKEIPFFFK
ncbi:hypothetical protein DL766_000604 [Monosporascus sp. MC13-8B]|uniref:Serine protease n=1 Tax=Monosporascus cannonballus TaxID=155416 RepID=A0ABY0HK64_9PEZI|nr:hypothetical protein DL762_000651 [Monosporascus cannonballus]RYP39062.1 hypothetical protein DL766_000604 [Monosporascus sp. MC13-8B]